MFPGYASPRTAPPGFPRARGDVPEAMSSPPHSTSFSPRTRGCSPGGDSTDQAELVFPAHAGMFPEEQRLWLSTAGFPRARGDVPSIDSLVSKMEPFSPRTRGCSYHQAR